VKLLTESAVARHDVMPLNQVDSFVAAQTQMFAPMLDQLNPARRERADESLALIRDVEERAELLRTGLACDTVTRDGADALGPKLRDCMTGTDATEPDEQHTGQGQRADTKEDEPKGTDDATVSPERIGQPAGSPDSDAPTDTDTATTPADEPASGNRSTGVPSPAGTPPADPGSDQDKGLLEGVLGGIFD
jgi:hypothetical protein